MKKYIFDTSLYQKALFVLSILLNIILIIIIFATINEDQIYKYFNSDTLYLPSVYKDLFIDNSGLEGWHFNPAPNFFPDMLLFFIIRSFFDSFIPACFAFSLLQFMLLLILLSLLYRFIFKSINYIHLSLATLLMALFLLVTLINNDFLYTFYILSVSFHVGAFMMCLVSIFLLFKYLEKGNKSFLITLLFLGIVSTVSDPLYLIMFSLPAYALLLLLFTKSSNRVKIKNILIVNTFSIISGVLCHKLIRLPGYIHFTSIRWRLFNFDNIVPSLKIMIGQHLIYLKQMDYRGLIDVLFLISFIFHAILLGKNLIYTLNKNNRIQINELELVYLVIFVAFVLSVLFTPIINGSYIVEDILRYNIYVLYLGIFSFSYLIFKFFNSLNVSIKNLNLFIVVVLISGFILLISKYETKSILTGLTNFMNYYPEKVRCIDQLSKEENLKYGVADYWQAKYITMFSKENVRVYSVFPDSLTPFYHVMNESWYYPSPRGKFNNPKFNFVVLERFIDRKKLIEIFNEPIEIFFCPRGVELYKYPRFEFDRKTGIPYLSE